MNLIVQNMVKKLGLEVHGHPSTNPLGWVNKDVELKVTIQCKIIFSINVNFIYEVELDVFFP